MSGPQSRENEATLLPRTPWYHQKWFVIVSIFVFPPAGAVLLWTSSATRRTGRIVWTIVASLLFVIYFGGRKNDSGGSIAATIPATTAKVSAPGAASFKPPPPPPSKQLTIIEIKAEATTPKYDDLARNPEQYKGKPLTFRGEVVQVAGRPSQPILRVNVTQKPYSWEDTIWVTVYGGDRVLDKDIIQLWGIGKGEMEYTTVLRSVMRIPAVDALDLQVISKAGDRK